jgi:hypothetical protein
MEIDELRRAIESAFGRLRVPFSRWLFYKNSAPAKGSDQEELGKLAGKRWQDVDHELLKRNHYGYWRLRPRAYRYYLPARLIAALDEQVPDKYGSLMSSVVSDLIPDFRYLYYGEPDPKLQARQRLFTDVQYRIVVAFLGKAFERGDDYLKYRAMQALFWGWNRMDTPELAAATAYYHSLRNHTYPVPADAVVAALFIEIHAAFAETPYPGDADICNEGFTDSTYAEYATEYRGVKWQGVHPELLGHSTDALSYFSDAAFRYYLPAALLSDLADYNWLQPQFHLTHGFETEKYDATGFLNYLRSVGEDETYIERVRQDYERDPTEMRPRSISRWSGFTVPERRAIISYLEYYATQEEFAAPTIYNALEQYWLPSMEGQ